MKNLSMLFAAALLWATAACAPCCCRNPVAPAGAVAPHVEPIDPELAELRAEQQRIHGVRQKLAADIETMRNGLPLAPGISTYGGIRIDLETLGDEDKLRALEALKAMIDDNEAALEELYSATVQLRALESLRPTLKH